MSSYANIIIIIVDAQKTNEHITHSLLLLLADFFFSSKKRKQENNDVFDEDMDEFYQWNCYSNRLEYKRAKKKKKKKNFLCQRPESRSFEQISIMCESACSVSDNISQVALGQCSLLTMNFDYRYFHLLINS